jgi:hypothetical protein
MVPNLPQWATWSWKMRLGLAKIIPGFAARRFFYCEKE